ncbi:gluconokinase [Chondromyces crocatus]|uniref:Gluconokinase n=1 Tax=Chondromyces crocatus TaxID=52 RepID=A0A0K1EFJ2_CHOCO|nr:gluconokinase [Chondromyces crocatus]AKT39467.1 gluconate kinase [Chondromyces crocatus]
MVILVLGVSGAGKTTVGQKLAEAIGARFCDADDLHPRANLDKMAHGIPLDDDDRAPWLATLRRSIEQWLREDGDTVLACSALKASYRDLLAGDEVRVRLVFLRVPIEVARARVTERKGHFMPPGLLESQFEALEEPGDAIVVDATRPPDTLVHDIRVALAR